MLVQVGTASMTSWPESPTFVLSEWSNPLIPFPKGVGNRDREEVGMKSWSLPEVDLLLVFTPTALLCFNCSSARFQLGWYVRPPWLETALMGDFLSGACDQTSAIMFTSYMLLCHDSFYSYPLSLFVSLYHLAIPHSPLDWNEQMWVCYIICTKL